MPFWGISHIWRPITLVRQMQICIFPQTLPALSSMRLFKTSLVYTLLFYSQDKPQNGQSGPFSQLDSDIVLQQATYPPILKSHIAIFV